MKLLYITPMINGEGGVQKVLSIKTNYLIENYDYQIDILTQDNGHNNLFFDFNSKIGLFDMVLSNNKCLKFFQYRNKIQKQIKISRPDVIIVCNTELKALLLPLTLNYKNSIIYEIHSAKNNESKKSNSNIITCSINKLRSLLKGFFIKYFDTVVALSPESLSQWRVKKYAIIPNPIEKNTTITANLKSKKVIVVARHSYEKGLDKLLKIWQLVLQNHPDWILEIYGTEDKSLGYKKFVTKKKLNNAIHFFEPIKNITDRYLQASIYLMTSRNEALPMVLIEAMNCGLPCIAYDCPVGPRAMIVNNINGFLIENSNENDFVNAVCKLISDENLRIKLGKNAKLSSLKYQIEPIMEQWNALFIRLKINHK